MLGFPKFTKPVIQHVSQNLHAQIFDNDNSQWICYLKIENIFIYSKL